MTVFLAGILKEHATVLTLCREALSVLEDRCWVVVKELTSSYYIGGAILFTVVTRFKVLNSNPVLEVGKPLLLPVSLDTTKRIWEP